MIMNTTIFPALAAFSEVDLFKNWIIEEKRFTLVGQPTPFINLFHYTLDLPWPLRNREISLACHGIPIPDESMAVIVCYDMPDEYLGFQSPEIDSKSIQINILFGCFAIKYLRPNKTKITLICRSDPHMTFLPKWIISFLVK
jgi:hypothetical protein